MELNKRKLKRIKELVEDIAEKVEVINRNLPDLHYLERVNEELREIDVDGLRALNESLPDLQHIRKVNEELREIRS